MTLGSETKTDVEVPIINGKHEIPQEENDSGHSSINTPDSSEPGEKNLKLVFFYP